MSLASFLSGKKTFILSGLAVASIAVGMATHTIPVTEGVPGILVAAGIATNRQGSKNDAVHAAATVINELAPVIAAVVPSAAKAAASAGAVAGAVAAATVVEPPEA